MEQNITINDDAFIAIFGPVKNAFDDNASFDGCMYETFGADYQHCTNQQVDRLWTIIEVDGVQSIISGFHFVNRIGYLITMQPWPHNVNVNVTVN